MLKEPRSTDPDRQWCAPYVSELAPEDAAELLRLQPASLIIALELAATGIPTFPVKVTRKLTDDGERWQKKPLVSDWRRSATTEEAQLRDWWATFPNAIPGIELGRAGLIVIDADRHGGPDGVALLAELARPHGRSFEHAMGPGRVVVVTPTGGGEHHIFRQPDEGPLGNRRGNLPYGIDVRGAGGWIVAPGSVRPDGGVWRANSSLVEAYKDGAIPQLPPWLAAQIRTRPEPPAPPPSAERLHFPARSLAASREVVYAYKALNSIADELRATPPNTCRNDRLNAGAYRLGRMAARGWIDKADVVEALSEAARASGLDTGEIQQTLTGGLKAGFALPAKDLRDRVPLRTVSANGPPDPIDRAQASVRSRANEQNGPVRKSQADHLIEITNRDGVELFRSPDGSTFADIISDGHRETWPTKSAAFRGWLKRTYYTETGGAPGSEAMTTAMGVIEAQALFDGVEREVHLRVAEQGDRIYLDLCDTRWRAIEITPDGWSILDDPPVRFRRTTGMLPIPDPVRGGSVDELRMHLHVDDVAYVLAVSWLLAILRGRGPYPILALTGEQGTGKSLTAQRLRALVDPHSAPLRSLPRDSRDLYVAAINGYVLVFDNLSAISTDISDALCRLSTGGGFATRALYTDHTEVIFDGQRPIALTSITDVASRSDLADRLLLVRLEVIPDTERRTEAELHNSFDEARPRILGALLDVVAHGLMQLPQTRLDRLPRMADYATWVRACETGIWAAGMHMAAYETNRAEAVDVVLDADPIAMALRHHMEGRAEHVTTATELLIALGRVVGDHVRRGRQWPGNARALSGQLARLGPALRRIGIEVEHFREGGSGRRLIRLIGKTRP
jgi:hypothetical protein